MSCHAVINYALFAVVEEKLSDAKRQLKDVEAKLAFATAFQQQVIYAATINHLHANYT